MPQHIIVRKYDSAWKQSYESEKELISSILGDNLVAIDHIGSTAVEGLSAKPIIDIMPVVKDLEEADRVSDAFQKIGYEYLGEFGIHGRRYLRKGGDERTHQIHIFKADDQYNIERHLAVRDYLRSHPREARQYGEFKSKLALQFPYDIDGYCDGKENFVRQLECKAVEWYRKNQ